MKIKSTDFFYVLLNQLSILIGGLLFNKVISNLFDKHEIGVYYYILTIASLFLVLFFSAFNQVFSRKINANDKINICSFSIFNLILVLFVSLPIFIYFPGKEGLVTIGLLFTFLYRDIIFTYMNQSGFRKQLALVNVATVIFRIIFVLMACMFFKSQFTVLYAQLASTLLTIIFALIFSFGMIKCDIKSFIKSYSFDFAVDKGFYFLALPIIISSISTWAKDMGVRLIIEHNLSVNDVADFSLLNSLSNIGPSTIQSIIIMYYLPLFYNGTKDFFNVLKRVILVFVFTTILGFIFFEYGSYFIVKLFLDDKYALYSNYLSYMFISQMLFFMISFLGVYFFIINKTVYLIPSSVISVILIFIFVYCFSVRWGFPGVVFGMLAALSVALIFMILQFLTVYKAKREAINP